MNKPKESKNRRCFALTPTLRFCKKRGNWQLFCPQHKRIWIIYVVFTIFTLGGGFLAYYQFLNPLLKQAVLISPSRIDLGKGDRKGITTVSVINNSERSLYGIVIKMVLKSDSLSIQNNDIKIIPLPYKLGSLPLTPINRDVSISIPDCIIVRGINEFKESVFYLIIDKLIPKQSKTFRVDNQTRQLLSLSNHFLFCYFLKADNKPQFEIRREQGPDALSIALPAIGEKFTLKGAEFFDTPIEKE